MLRRDLLRALLASPLTGWLGPATWATFVGTTDNLADAADLYRKVFAWSEGLNPDEMERIEKAATASSGDAGVRAFLRKARPMLEAAREAATIPDFRWEKDTITEDDLNQGHLSILNVNKAIRILCLSARRFAEMGKGRESLNDLFAGLTLAHRVGTGGPLIARLLECGGEMKAFQTLGRILPGLDRETLDDLSLRLDALPAPEPASATIGPESRFILGSIRTRLAALGPKIEPSEWADLGFSEGVAEALGRLTGGDSAAFLAHLDAIGPSLAELARTLDLPRPGCRPALEAFAEAERSRHPIAAKMADWAWGVRHVVDRMRATRAMLRAGLLLVRDGEPAFLTIPDPFGTGAFGLERRGDGFRIRSDLRDLGQTEVTLQVGDEDWPPPVRLQA